MAESIKIPNTLNFTKTDFSERETKLMYLIFERVQTKEQIEFIKHDLRSLEAYSLEFNFSELGEKNYTRIIAMANSIINKKLYYKNKAENHYLKINPFITVEIKDNKLYLEINHHALFLFINFGKGTGEGYTSLPKSELLSINGKYNLRLFELLSARKKLGTWEINTAELRELLNIPELTYSNFSHFKEQILDKAQKELSEKTGINFTYEITGRERKKVTKIKFTITANDNNKKAGYIAEKSDNAENCYNLRSDKSPENPNLFTENKENQGFSPPNANNNYEFNLNLFAPREINAGELAVLTVYLNRCGFSELEKNKLNKIIPNAQYNLFYVAEFMRCKEYNAHEKINNYRHYFLTALEDNLQQLKIQFSRKMLDDNYRKTA
jgi:hypothetical protein